jgi:hypothetical protein
VPVSIVESSPLQIFRRKTMPYIVAWLLGVPAFVLVLIWLFMH